jgi:hypothetical protein
MMVSQTKLNPIDQTINFIYYLYSTAFEDVSLKEIDPQTFVFIPRCLWDTSCEHYDQCVHELIWKQYACSVIQHAIKYQSMYFNKESSLFKLDTLDLLVWYCFNTNICEVIMSMFCELNLEQVAIAVNANHDDMFELFSKYLKRVG